MTKFDLKFQMCVFKRIIKRVTVNFIRAELEFPNFLGNVKNNVLVSSLFGFMPFNKIYRHFSNC